ncbi:hypothetical protein HanIR_Chr12g0594131 [Helianthus annuus]|nr:hypothetical protein HanIR_Chr12g0594131 [Helianthus annuus]
MFMLFAGFYFCVKIILNFGYAQLLFDYTSISFKMLKCCFRWGVSCLVQTSLEYHIFITFRKYII